MNFSVLRDIFVCFLQIYMLNTLEKNILPYRSENFFKRMSIYFIGALCAHGIHWVESTVFNMLAIPMVYMMISILVFKGSTWKKIIITCCFYMLAIVPEFLFAVYTEEYGVIGKTEKFQSEVGETLAYLLMSTVTFLLIKCINQVTRKRNYLTIENKVFSVLLMLPVATIVILGCIFYSDISFEGVNRFLIPMGAVLLLMTNIFIFTVFDNLIEKSEEIKKMETLYQKSKAENTNMQYINKITEENNAFLHDVNKFIRITASLIENGENQKVKEIAEHLDIRIQNLKKTIYTDHPILNSILCEREFVTESKKVTYKVNLDNNLRLDFFEDLDLISIVGNLLDNAVEAAEQTERNRYVECKMYMGNAGHFLVMEFHNGYLVSPIKDKGRFVSTKKDSNNHGIGLHTVAKLVKKYEGIMKVEADGRKFSVKLFFTIK